MFKTKEWERQDISLDDPCETCAERNRLREKHRKQRERLKKKGFDSQQIAKNKQVIQTAQAITEALNTHPKCSVCGILFGDTHFESDGGDGLCWNCREHHKKWGDHV